MVLARSLDADGGEVLWRDGDRVFRRTWVQDGGHEPRPAVLVCPASTNIHGGFLDRLKHEFEIRDVLDPAWAWQPLDLDLELAALIYDDHGRRPLSELTYARLGLPVFLRLATASARAVSQMHARGLIHKDIRPENLFSDVELGRVWITGFGVATRLPRERRSPMPPETIEGTLAYMAPEQTGRMNRSVDARSDLYALGVTLYQLLTGSLPFSANDPMEWIHSHVARQPASLREKAPNAPKVVAEILLKLLEKSADARYQTARGLELDLQRCLDECLCGGAIEQFELGRGDFTSELPIPEGLYGRRIEVNTLIEALNGVSKTSAPTLVLVSGYSGIGKTSVVNELQWALAPKGGLFAAGKFDQFKRDIPYASFAQAFQGLVRQLLGKDEPELTLWREKLVQALGPHGELVVNLIPELKLIIGEQPPVASLSGPEAQARLMSVFENFVGVFAREEHPLVLFLDDLQWLDPATLDLFAHLSTRTELRNLLLVGAYRDNEVDAAHPLTRHLDTILASGHAVHEIRLDGMHGDDVRAMLADVLDAKQDTVERLSEVVIEKAGGNPFFILQFVGAMADEGLIVFDAPTLKWRWDAERISTKKVSENVVDLMIERMSRLSPSSVEALKLAACMGSSIDVEQFHHVLGETERETQELLRDALRTGLLLRVDAIYAFAHDRVQEAAYALLTETERASTHLRIGTKLLALGDRGSGDRVFDVVDQFNRAALSTADFKTRILAATLNLRAGVKAKSASAYPAAKTYLAHGLAYLGETLWRDNYDLAFDLSLQQAECTFLGGDLIQTSAMVEPLLERAVTKTHLAMVYRLKVELHVVKSENIAATQAGLAALRLFGIDFSEHPSQGEVEEEFNEIWLNLGDGPITSFADLPMMKDPEMLALMRVLAEMWPPSFFTDFNLTTLVACRIVNISFLHGIAASSNQGLALLGWIMGPALGRWNEGYAIVKLAGELAQRQVVSADMARVFNTMSLTASWTRPLAESIEWYRTAYRVGIEAGDLFFACFSSSFIAMTLLQQGHDLENEATEIREYLATSRATGFRDGIDMIVVPERASACLRGLTASLTDFSDASFSQSDFESGLKLPRAPVVGWWYWTRKVMLHYMAGEFEAALRAHDMVETGSCKIVQIQHLDYYFYGALACAARIDELGGECCAHLRARLDVLRAQLGEWAETTQSPIFTGKHILVSAEAARLGGLELEAQSLYEKSIRLSKENEFLQDEGLANEAAARYYVARGFDKIGAMYLREARRCFHKWGASAKVELLDRSPILTLGQFDRPDSVRELPRVSLEQLDLATVIRVSQALSREVVLDKLVDTIMEASIEHAGAERAVLLLDSETDGLQVVAEASSRSGPLRVDQVQRNFASIDLARSIVLYVLRTNEPVILDDASVDAMFASDRYVRDTKPQSVLCLPLANQGRRIGLLYLENNFSPKVFSPGRLALARLLASQAAVSLEKIRLYSDLEEREAKIRRLVDANVIGIIIWDRDGRLLDANDSFLKMTQYTREDLENGLGWFDMTPPDWQAQVEYELLELTTTGVMQPREKEYFRCDGSRLRVLIGAAAFGDRAQQGVAFILDLTEREMAERKAVESEQRFRDLQSELAHANRVETVGQLSTWIAHDVKQPLVGIVASANAGYQWLSASPPNVEAARRSLQRVEEEGHRAGDILDKIRTLMKKSNPVREVVNVNELVQNTLPLLHSEVRHNAIVVRVELTETMPMVSADRVQLQQVLMNMVVNAIDAMSTSSGIEKKLTISTEIDEGGNAIVSVRDTGPLVPSEQYERFFEAFYSTKQDGLGIGLAICKNIIENYGGKIWGEPCVPHGTSVRFSLPGLASV